MELIDILKADPGADGMSAAELIASMQWRDTPDARRRILARLKEEIKANRVECGDAIRPRIDGKPCRVPVYKVKA